jgi:hypothetical protein
MTNEDRARELAYKLLSGHINDTILTANILDGFEAVRSEAERRTLERAARMCETIAASMEAEGDVAAMISAGARRNTAYQIRALIDKPAVPDPMLDRTSALNADSILKYTVNRIVERDIDKEALTRVRVVLRRFAGLPPLPEELPPDPLDMALAKFFRDWKGGEFIKQAAYRAGLVNQAFELTDLGRAALALAEDGR